MPVTEKGKNKTSTTSETPEEKTDIKKSKSVKLRAKRFMTWNCRGVEIKGEPEKTPEGKYKTTPDGKKMVGKVITISEDMWPDPKAYLEVVNSLVNNEYFEIVQ